MFASLCSTLSAASVVMWVRSYTHWDFLRLRPVPAGAAGPLLYSHVGTIWLVTAARDPLDGRFHINSFSGMVIPYSAIVAVILLPLVCVPGWKYRVGRRRIEPGRCAKCGYDLRASPDRCPECGTIVSGAG